MGLEGRQVTPGPPPWPTTYHGSPLLSPPGHRSELVETASPRVEPSDLYKVAAHSALGPWPWQVIVAVVG